MTPDLMIYEGKAKKVFRDPVLVDQLILEFKDSLTAFNAQKKGSFENKGAINRDIAALVFEKLRARGIESHFIANEGSHHMRVRRVEIIPLEVVVRNILAGSTAKKLGIPEGAKLDEPLVEFYFKKDELGDPFVSDDQILMLKIADPREIQGLKSQALKVNQVIKELFFSAGLTLVDFKLEFGRDRQGQLVLADEITPDCCRLWDTKTQEKFDKDRFRRDLGGVKEGYEAVLHRLREALQKRG